VAEESKERLRDEGSSGVVAQYFIENNGDEATCVPLKKYSL
jgi:hypothetical protein